VGGLLPGDTKARTGIVVSHVTTPPGLAGSATANVSVSANIANVCTISTCAVAFGAYDPIVTNASTPWMARAR
jgi:hypothetical protein